MKHFITFLKARYTTYITAYTRNRVLTTKTVQREGVCSRYHQLKYLKVTVSLGNNKERWYAFS